jgi:molecular chaperone GrpE
MAHDTTGEENANENKTVDNGSAEAASEAPEGTASAAGTEAPQSSAAAESVVEEWKNRAVYLAAEIDNMRKRFVRDRADLVKSANEDLLKGILPVYDNLFLALRSIRETNERKEARGENPGAVEKLFENLLKGVEMTFTHFEQTLDRSGVKAIDAVGQKFDPAVHEAVGQSSDANYGDDIVTAELQRGFVLHGRLLRTARVIVNKITQS